MTKTTIADVDAVYLGWLGPPPIVEQTDFPIRAIRQVIEGTHKRCPDIGYREASRTIAGYFLFLSHPGSAWAHNPRLRLESAIPEPPPAITQQGRRSL